MTLDWDAVTISVADVAEPEGGYRRVYFQFLTVPPVLYTWEIVDDMVVQTPSDPQPVTDAFLDEYYGGADGGYSCATPGVPVDWFSGDEDLEASEAMDYLTTTPAGRSAIECEIETIHDKAFPRPAYVPEGH